MDTYLDLMQGCLQLADILDASGKRQTDLPMLPKYTHPNGRSFFCWLCILPQCRYHECRFLREGGHPDPANITDNFANSAAEVLSKGIIARVNQLQSGGSPQIKKQKLDAGHQPDRNPSTHGIWGCGVSRVHIGIRNQSMKTGGRGPGSSKKKRKCWAGWSVRLQKIGTEDTVQRGCSQISHVGNGG
jgi:hypothetical protein